jgi:hypothetical protein
VAQYDFTEADFAPKSKFDFTEDDFKPKEEPSLEQPSFWKSTPSQKLSRLENIPIIGPAIEKLVGPPVINPDVPLTSQGVIPSASAAAVGFNGKPGALTASPAMLLPEPRNALEAAEKKLVEQVNPLNIILGGQLAALHKLKDADTAQKILKAGIGTYFAREGAKTIGAAGGEATAGLSEPKIEPSGGPIPNLSFKVNESAMPTPVRAGELGADILMGAGMAAAPMALQETSTPKSGLTPEDVAGTANLTTSDRDYIAGRRPPELQLEDVKGHFAVDPSGRTIDLDQLTERERAELFRGITPYQERPGVTPAREVPPIIVKPATIPATLSTPENTPATEILPVERGSKKVVAGGMLSSGGKEFTGQETTPGFLKTAEQKVIAKPSPPEPTKPVEPSETSTPLEDVESKLRKSLEARDLKQAVSDIGDQPVEIQRKLVDKLLNVGKKKVPLSAGERTIFNEIWEKSVQQKLEEERTENARTQQEATEVHGDVLPQSREGTGKVPIEEGGARVQQEAEGGIPQKVAGTSLPATMQTARDILKMSPAEFHEKAGSYNKINLKIGEEASSSDYEELKQLKDKAREKMMGYYNKVVEANKEAKSNPTEENSSKYEKAANELSQISTLEQFYNEAIQSYENKTKTQSIESRGAAGGNISTFGLFDPANYSQAYRATAKATKEAVDAATRNLEVARKAFGNIARSFSTRHVIDQTLDAADNMANIIGQQQGKSVKLGIKPEQDEAASVLIASGFDKKRAQDFLSKAQKAKNKKVEAVVNYALKNWNSVEPVARRGQSAFENQLRQENASGIETERHEDYLPGVYDMDLMMGVNRPFVIGGQRLSGVGSGFKKGKAFASPFDAVEAGYTPKSLKLSDLVENRVRAGQRLINRRAWGDSLKTILDPTDNKPIAENLIVKRRPNGTKYETAPPGYVTRELLPGVRMGIHESYAKLFDALTGNSSAIRDFEVGGVPVGAMALEGVGGIKHGTLLLDTYHAMRVMKKQFFTTGKVGYNKGLSLLEYSPDDLKRAVREGDITQDMADYANQNRPVANLLIKNGLNVGRVQQAMYTSLVRKVPGIGGFNKWVFDKLTRGAMMESGISEFNRVKSNNPNMTDVEVARQVSRDLNKYFGNLQRQGLFKSKTMLDVSGLAGFAPQWVESQVRSELGGIKQLTVDPILKRQLAVGTLGSSMARGLVAYIAATQILNLATRQKFTWQNEEKDHKLDAWVPDVTGKTGGYWMSPLSGAAENTKDVMDAVSNEPDALSAAGKIISNKSGSLVRAGKILLQGRDWRDQKIIGSWNKTKQAAIQLAPVPIPLSTTIKGGSPGSTQRQIMQSLGEKVTPAKTANQQIGDMARKWGLSSKDPKVKFQFEQQAQTQYGDSAFKPVRDAIKEQDSKKIVAAVQTILDREPTEEAAGKRLTELLSDFSPFTNTGLAKHFATNSKENEQKFLQSLDPQGRKLWVDALKDRVKDYRQLTAAIYGRAKNPPMQEQYQKVFAE